MKRLFLLYLALCTIGLAAPRAQMRVVPVDEEQGHVALGLALRHLGNAGIFMQATAHPDDEDNGLLFGGDTYNTGPIYAHLPDSDVDAFARSTARMAELADGVAIVYVAHFSRYAEITAMAASHVAYELLALFARRT